MMHQRLLLPAFHLITRGIPWWCINSNSGCSISIKQKKFISCGEYSRLGAYNYSTTIRRRYSSTQQHNSSRHHHTNGPITHRSQSFTHLDQVEDAITSVVQHYQQLTTTTHTSQESTSSSSLNALQEKNNILHKLQPHQREALSVSNILSKRIRSLTNSNDCRRCWLQKKHCVCNYCTSLEDEQDDDDGEGKRRKGIPNVNRLFLLVSV